jgi:hypothetical protein
MTAASNNCGRQRYEIQSDKADHIAMQKGFALHKVD